MFIDFKKAFDSIHRGKMLRILKSYGIPGLIVAAIRLLYTETKTKALPPDEETQFFEILGEGLQGHTLPPQVLSIMLDYAMGQAIANEAQEIGFKLDQKRIRSHNSDTNTGLELADDS